MISWARIPAEVSRDPGCGGVVVFCRAANGTDEPGPQPYRGSPPGRSRPQPSLGQAIGVAAPAAQRRQVFDIDVDEPGRGLGLEGDGRRLLRVRRADRTWRLRQRCTPLRDSCGLRQRRIASTMSSSGRARLRRSSTIRASSQAVIGVARRCGRVERSATSGRAFQRATVRGWIPSSRASAAREAVLCWI